NTYSRIPGDPAIHVSLLTGGSDKPYVIGLTGELISKGAILDLIGSDELDCKEIRNQPGLRFLNLRGDLRENAALLTKAYRVARYYFRLFAYAATAKPKVFHILWNNKFEILDRTILMLYYKALGKRIVLTAHNINARQRDSDDSLLNRLTLRIQYRLADHIFVHTDKAKCELVENFGTREARVTAIPFGINNSVPVTALTSKEAKRRLGIGPEDRTILFYGRITPYKGLEYLAAAFRQVLTRGDNYRLVIAGRPDRCDKYWNGIRGDLREEAQRGKVVLRAEFISDDETEVYFKAADVLVLPYRHIYQSGVLFLSLSFGLPVLAADVGSLKDDIVEGKTGFVFHAEDPSALARALDRYFASDLFADLESRRSEIRACAAKRHSWDAVGQSTMSEYGNILKTDQRRLLTVSRVPHT